MPSLTRKGALIAGIVAILVVAVAIVLPIVLDRQIKQGILQTLRDRFESDVQYKSLHVGLYPHIHASVQGIVLRHRGRTDISPLMTIDTLSVTGSLYGFFRWPKRIRTVALEGLQIHIPPPAKREVPPPSSKRGLISKLKGALVVEQVVSSDALIETLPREAGHPPRDIQIHRFTMRELDFTHPAPFHATLSIPKPLGQIECDGRFGPWQPDEPGETPVSGTFRVPTIDLSTLGGISGTLSSHGEYSGILDRLNVDGDTATPDFALKIQGNPVPLWTHYVAVVDGTNGNTVLESVTARLLHSTILTSGEVIGIPGGKGHHIVVEAVSRGARVEDFLRLAVSDKSPMSGSVSLHAKIDIPPGEDDLVDRMLLRGQFGIAGARFTDPELEAKLDSLSRKGQGQPKNEDIQNVISNLNGRFVVRKGTATFSNLAFDVPGAAVHLAGSYGLRSGLLDFHGHLLLNVKLSKTTTGAKSFFMKFIDPFFKTAAGGSSIPIKITGSRSNPAFGLDLHRGSDHDHREER